MVRNVFEGFYYGAICLYLVLLASSLVDLIHLVRSRPRVPKAIIFVFIALAMFVPILHIITLPFAIIAVIFINPIQYTMTKAWVAVTDKYMGPTL